MNSDDYEFMHETAAEVLAELRQIKAALKTSYVCDSHHGEVPDKTLCVLCLAEENFTMKAALKRIERTFTDMRVYKTESPIETI